MTMQLEMNLQDDVELSSQAEAVYTPAIRFKGFSGAWEVKCITELAKIFIGLVTTMTKYYTNEGALLIRNSDIKNNRFEFSENPIYLEKNFAEKHISRKLKIGDVVTVHTGDIGTSAVITKKEEDAIGFATIVSRPYEDLIKSDYLSVFLNTDTHRNFATNVSTGDGRANYNLKDYYKLGVPYPVLDEQTAIGNYFQQLDSLIAQHRRKHTKLLNLKQALLQKMFPKQGATVPEVRFQGFSGDWEVKEFGDCFSNIPNNTLSRADLNEEVGLAKNIHYGDVLIKFGEILDLSKEKLPFITKDEFTIKSKTTALKDGDIIIADAAEDETVGKCTELCNIGDQIVFSGLHTIAVRPTQLFASKYLGYYLNSSAYHDQLLPLMQGTKVLSISKTKIQKTSVIFPKNTAEQTKIGQLFQQLDHLITQQHALLTKLGNLKQAYLAKMFI